MQQVDSSGSVAQAVPAHGELPPYEWLTAPWAETAPIGELMNRIASIRRLSIQDLLASFIKDTLTSQTPLSQLLQYVIDVAGDQFTAEEFYLRYPELLSWLARAGCSEDEVQLRAYIIDNPQIFTCRTSDCSGKIVGGCPKLYCEECETKYVLHIDHLTKRMCANCVARKLGECTEQSMRSRKPIYGILPGGLN